jgi:hypothetical protein
MKTDALAQLSPEPLALSMYLVTVLNAGRCAT